MKRRNTIAIAAVLVALLALAAAIYFLRPQPSSQPSTAQAPAASESPAPAAPAPSAETAPAETAPDAEEKTADTSAEEKTAETPAATEEDTAEKAAEEPAATEDKTEDTPAPAEQKAEEEPAPAEDEKTAEAAPEPQAAEPQPSFDVVRIEPTGEGVLAGRAAPGWNIVIESRGVKVAEAAADDQGEWTVVFDRPLSPGTHDLSVKATSPDGSKEFSSTQSVSADVAEPPTKKAELPEAETARLSDAAPAAVPPASPSVTPGATSGSAPSLPQTAAIQEGKATPPSALPQQIKPGSYTILPGDTLWDIATRYLGAGWRYKQIYKDNRQIIRNPNLIYPEQKMAIPEPPSEVN